MKKGLIILSFAVFVACAAPKLLTPTSADANRGAQKFPGYTLADLDRGKTLYETKCTACHRAKDPAPEQKKNGER